MSTLVTAVRALLDQALAQAHDEDRARLETLAEFLDQPPRIALAGAVKSGKSTLLNALIGDRLAPTDTSECTKIVTVYRHHPHYMVEGVDLDGHRGPLPFDRDVHLHVELGDRPPEDYRRLEVGAPTPRLEPVSVLDLPGHDSLSPDVRDRARSYLVADDEVPVDAVIYLMRHRHPADLEFLEAFHNAPSASSHSGAIGVLSRPDELAGGHLDAMEIAADVAGVLAADDRIRSTCLEIKPVAGLLAESALTLTQAEFGALSAIAATAMVDRDLLSVDRFAAGDPAAASGEVRRELLARFGLFGVRAALGWIRAHSQPTSDGLSSYLVDLSGIGRLRTTIRQRIIDRSGVLRARLVLDGIETSGSLAADADLTASIVRIRSEFAELQELDALDVLRSHDDHGLSPADADRLARLLGESGPGMASRLGVDDATGDLRQLATDERAHWAGIQQSPFATSSASVMADLALRACDRIIHSS